jgi:methionyl-tRNA formyltransferase
MKRIALYLGDSTGLKILKDFINKKIAIAYVVSTDEKYKKHINKICKNNLIKYFFFNKTNNHLPKAYNKDVDIIISIFSRYIFPKKFIDNFGGYIFNIHPGLLPFYPGTNSISGTIFNQEKFSGVTIHLVTDKIDGGDIVLKKKFKLKKIDLAINVWQKIQKISIGLAKDLYQKNLNNELVFKKNKVNTYRKIFPKFIPNNGFIRPNIDNLKNIMILYRASYYFPYNSPWGCLKFLYKNKVNKVISIQKYKKVNYSLKNIKKINNETYLIKLKNNIIAKVTTN